MQHKCATCLFGVGALGTRGLQGRGTAEARGAPCGYQTLLGSQASLVAFSEIQLKDLSLVLFVQLKKGRLLLSVNSFLCERKYFHPGIS